MKKLILAIALAFAFALPFAETADAYGERWYMVKTATHLTGWGDRGRRGCHMNIGDRFERDQRYQLGRWMYGRKVGGPIWCKGHIKHSRVYNMDTVVSGLGAYEYGSHRSNVLNLYRNKKDALDAYAEYKRTNSTPRKSQSCYRGVFRGNKIHVFEDRFDGAIRVIVLDGPCKDKQGWIISEAIRR